MIDIESDDKIVESRLNKWSSESTFKFNRNSNKPIFSVDTPPPYVNGILHLGHGMDYTMNDAVARFERLSGKEVIFPLGFDKNGLPIEAQVEKEYNVNILNVDREKFIQLCKSLFNKYYNENKDIIVKLGLSFNSLNPGNEVGDYYETDSEIYRTITQQIFIDLWKKGYIYEDRKIVNFCPVCHTTLADSEVEYEEKETKLYIIKLENDLSFATTRPELIPACAAFAANPNDNRYKNLKSLRLPITKHEVPVVFDESIDPNFGTGLMMLCSYGDKRDVDLIKKFNLPEKIIINEEGRIYNTGLPYDGLSISDARKKIIEDIKNSGFGVEEKTITSERPICWRSKTPIEFIPEKEFYVKQREFKKDLLDLSMKMKFHSESSRQILIDWINSIDQDWPISRTRYYGTEIPLWKCMDCGEYLYVEDGKYHQPWKEPFPLGKCPKCGSSNIVGETRILDTWFDSSHSQLFILGFLYDKDIFSRAHPASIRVHGKEIVRSWTYYSLVESFLLEKEVPFKHVLVHYHVVDAKGEKMSKSKGNTMLLKDAINFSGPDAFRSWVFMNGNPLDGDVRFSRDKLDEARRFINKLKNIAKFVSQFDFIESDVNEFDEIFLKHFNFINNNVIDAYSNYDFFTGLLQLRLFLVNIFADHFIEIRKAGLYSGDKSAMYTVNYILMNSLILLNPIIPFTTDYLFEKIYGKDINKQLISKRDKFEDNSKLIEKLMDFDSKVWKFKKQNNLSLNSEIESFTLDEDLSKYKDLLSKAHKIKTWLKL